jgi:hypothetical protein
MPLTCTKAHNEERMANELSALRESQSKVWRHKCAACAYEKGVEHGKELGRREAERERHQTATAD